MSRFRQGGGRILAVTNKPAPIADWIFMHPILNTANWLVNETDLGTGVVAAASSMMAVLAGVGKDHKITADLKATTGTVDLRVMARFCTNLSQDSVNSARYYYAGVTSNEFRIGKVVDGTFTTLASTPYVLALDTWATFTLKVFGGKLVATITDGVTPASLSVDDTSIPAGGVQGFRCGPTGSCNIYCRSWKVEEVAA